MIVRFAPHRLRAAVAFPLVSILALVAACGPAAPAAETTDIYLAAPWEVGERLEYSLRDETGELLGRGILMARMDDQGRLLLEQRYLEAAPEGVQPIEDDVVVVVDPTDLRPVSGWRDIVRRDGDGSVVEERYDWEYLERDGDRVLVSRWFAGDGPAEERELRVRDLHYDNESSLWLWRSIDFIEDYDEHYTSVNPIERTQQTVNLRVPQVEAIEVPSGEFQAWRIIVRTGRAARTAWINVEPPHEVLRWDNGEVIFDLERRTVE